VQGTSFLSQIVPLIESSQAFRPRRSESCGSFRARACEPPAARPGGSQNRRAAGGRDGIRHYGFLANGARTERLARCCRLLNLATKPDEAKIADEHDGCDRKLTWRDLAICPDCGGAMQHIAIVPRSPPPPFRCDTS
jgi:hypothetical protein